MVTPLTEPRNRAYPKIELHVHFEGTMRAETILRLARRHGVGLAAVGLFTTSLFVMHLLLQIPAGKASDRFGERRVSLVGLVLIVWTLRRRSAGAR